MSTINLLPDDYVARRSRRRLNALCLLLFAVVMSGVVTAAVVSDQSSRHTQQVRDQVNAAYAQAARLIEQAQQLQKQRASLVARAERAADLQERVPRSYLLGLLTNACPEGASLSAVDLRTQPPGQGGAANKFQTVSMRRAGQSPSLAVSLVATGFARTDVDVAKYIAYLARSPLLSGVDLVYSEEKSVDNRTVREFQIRLEVVPNVDVIDVLKAAPQAAAGEELPLARRGDAP